VFRALSIDIKGVCGLISMAIFHDPDFEYSDRRDSTHRPGRISTPPVRKNCEYRLIVRCRVGYVVLITKIHMGRSRLGFPSVTLPMQFRRAIHRNSAALIGDYLPSTYADRPYDA